MARVDEQQFHLIRDRRAGERRQGSGDRRQAPGGIERRRGDRRRQAAATVLGGMVLVAAAKVPAGAQAARGGLSGTAVASLRWFVDPNSQARQQAEAWRASRPQDAAQMDKIAAHPQADWFGNWNADILSAVTARVNQITLAGALPVLVAYNIPNRDCGSHSGGGAADAAAYRDWIRRFALGIGPRPAVVILEPDALAQLCGDASAQQTRLDLMLDAVRVLKGNGSTFVYIDAGNSRWLSPEVAAQRLLAAGVAEARGFSLNVSNFQHTADEVAYGRAVSQRVGGKRFVVDTSRNGLGYQATWCNPSGRALGNRPTLATGDPLVDAFFWIKRPGQSDGTCNGGPAAGGWWADYALGLAQRAAY